ncbi:MAG: SseB family protein [Clostridiales bacterium]|nr:SseB family protein [Clostridiales bacterium]
MEEKVTMEITNERLEQAIREYAAERTREKLSAVLNLLRPTKLFVPAMLQGPNQPIPCFLRNNNGEQYLAVYTAKSQIPKEPKSQALLSMPFPACNTLVVKPELKLMGMVINPFSDNLVLKIDLVQKLHEADERAAEVRQTKMTPEQFHVFAKKQVEFGTFPKRLFEEGEDFVKKLCEMREAFVNEIFAEVYKDTKLYPYTEKDYSVMALDIEEDLTLVRVDLPEQGIVPPLCYRIYITFRPKSKEARYYTIEMSEQKDVHRLGEIKRGGMHVDYGVAPIEGAELQKMIELAGHKKTELTS